MSRAKRLTEKIEHFLEMRRLWIPHQRRPFYDENPRVHTGNEFTEGEKIYFNFMLGLSGYVVPCTVQKVTEKGVMLNCNGITYWVPKKGLQKVEDDNELRNLYWMETWVRRDAEQTKILKQMTRYDIYDRDGNNIEKETQPATQSTQTVRWKFPRGKVKEYVKGLSTGDVFKLYLFKKDLNDLETPAPVKLKVIRTSDKALLVSNAYSPDRNSATWIPRMAMNSYQDGLKLDDNLAVDNKGMSVYKTAYEKEAENRNNDMPVKAGL